MSEQATQASTQQNPKLEHHHPDIKQSKQGINQQVSSKHSAGQMNSQSDTEKKANIEGNSFGGSSHNDLQNQNNTTERVGSQYESSHHHYSNQNQQPDKQQSHLGYSRSDYSHYYGNNNNNISLCKNHSTKEATKICLHAACALTREICDYCEKQQPHSSHSASVVDAKKFFVDVELGLKEFRMNSPIMNASEMLEQARQFILRHFQSMNNMLVEKSHRLVTILSLIEQTESAKRTPMKTYELERFIRDVMDIFQIDKSGKLEAHNQLQSLDQDVIKEEISSVLFMIRDLENVVRQLHDDFAKALKFGDYGYYAGYDKNSHYSSAGGKHSNQYQQGASSHASNYNNYSSNHITHQNGGAEVRETSKSVQEPGSKYFTSTSGNSNIHQPQSYPHNYDSYQYNKNNNILLHPKENASLTQTSNSKNWGQQQFHPASYHQEMELEGGNTFNQKSKSITNIGLGSANILTSNQFNADVFMDPAFLKRPRGRPKGSKCKRKGKYKGKYTDEEKLQILQEVGKSKSVQVIAEKYSIQNSLIRYWARQLKYELDPQTVSSRRPYRTFSREQKKIIVNEAIKRRDIVMVAQEYDVNAQVLKRWILKGAQGALQSVEMRQMMNAVPNIGGEDEEDQSGDDSDLHSDEDEEDEEEEDDDEEDDDEEMEEKEDKFGEEQYFPNVSNLRTQENDSSNNNYKLNNNNNKKGISPTQKLTKKSIGPVESGQNSNSFNNLYNQHQNGTEQSENRKRKDQTLSKETGSFKDINTNKEENDFEQQNSLAKKIQKQLQQQQTKQEERSEDEDTEEESDEDEEYSSSHHLPQKKIKPNEENQKQSETQEKKQSPINNTQGNPKPQNKNSFEMKGDIKMNEILNLDVLKAVDLKNLNLTTDTLDKQEQLSQISMLLQKQLEIAKQVQEESQLKKKKHSEQKKQQNAINPKTSS